MIKKKLVEITWIDARGFEPGWHPDGDMGNNIAMKTYGLLVKKTKKTVIHASTFDPESEHWSEVGEIPAGMVRKIRLIETIEF